VSSAASATRRFRPPTTGPRSPRRKTSSDRLPATGPPCQWPSVSRAPRCALLYPRLSRDEFEGRFVGPMAYPDPRGERNNRMPAKRRPAQVSGLGRLRDPRDMAKAGLPESQSPDDETMRPSERHPILTPCPATAWEDGHRNLRGVERCPARAIKEMSGTPTSRSIRTTETNAGSTLEAAAPRGDGVLVGRRETRPQGEGAQVTGRSMTGRYA
jgi:hypothetical protein